MNRKQHSFVTVGITSLFLIFSVLCLVILALLTLGTSRSDLRMSRLALEQTTAYYDACGEVTDFCSELDALLSTSCTQAMDEEAYYKKVNTIVNDIAHSLESSPSPADEVSKTPDQEGGLFFSYDKTSRRICVYASFSENQRLFTELEILFPEKEGDSYLEILTWKTEVQGSWNPDTKQPVFKGEIQ